MFVFDNAPSHHKKADDALNANAMNLSPGGAAPKMRSTKWLTSSGTWRRQSIMESGWIEKALVNSRKRKKPKLVSQKPTSGNPYVNYFNCFLVNNTNIDISDCSDSKKEYVYITRNKGIKKVLEERQLWDNDFDLAKARAKLAEQPDFSNGVVSD